MRPERKNMRHSPAFRAIVAPYDAQDAVLRVTGRVFARARDVQQSVKKMNPVARLVRRLHIDDALIQLALINKKKAARALYEVRTPLLTQHYIRLGCSNDWGVPYCPVAALLRCQMTSRCESVVATRAVS